MPEPLADQFRGHFGHRQHLYGVLLDHLADDLEAGGPTAEVCRDQLDAVRADAIQLRLLAAVFRIVLRGEAPQLTPFYACLGGTAPAEQCWPVLRAVLPDHVAELRAGLTRPPQTNEVGRSAVLVAGLFEAVRRTGLNRVRLLELGASAGLNLHPDRYRVSGPGWTWGEPDSPLALDTEAADIRPLDLTIVRRGGCDLDPVDVTTQEGRIYLTSFVWPWQLERHARLAAALAVAQADPVRVDRAPASEWVAGQLNRPPTPGVLTIVWESITRQYWPAHESADVDAHLAEARRRMPLAHLSMEGVPPRQGTDGYDIRRDGPVLRLDGEPLARSHHHGPPVLLET